MWAYPTTLHQLAVRDALRVDHWHLVDHCRTNLPRLADRLMGYVMRGAPWLPPARMRANDVLFVLSPVTGAHVR